MSFKSKNKYNIWLDYCDKKSDDIYFIGLESEIFESEKKFREYATYGTINGKSDRFQTVDQINDEKFWKLFDFITSYFDMDASLFDEIEKSRINR
ncbi:MAG: hypothetical protein AB8B80_13205 [Marinicellaceae bacterium]